MRGFAWREGLRCTQHALLVSAVFCHASHGRSQAVMSGMHFDVTSLPPLLQEEFDQRRNATALRYLVRRNHTLSSTPSAVKGSPSPAVTTSGVSLVVTPTWAHRVTWQCHSCQGVWVARPIDRVNPQTRDQFACPHCAKGKCSTTTATAPSRDTLRKNATAPGPKTAFDEGEVNLSLNVPKRPGDGDTSSIDDRVASSRLVDRYPTLAAQWDVRRNNFQPSQAPPPLAEINATATAKVWWNCALCHQPWQEAVSARVVRLEKQLADRGLRGSSARQTFTPLCPACETRGAVDRVNGSVPAQVRAPRRTLLDDPLLMGEVRLTAHQNPAEISLQSEMLLSWCCRYCGYDYRASVAGRHDRHERCPQCSGNVATPLNLLVIQRPDVVHEVSVALSRTRLKHLTIHDDTTEIPLVCRTCLSPYRMTPKARCAIPKGGIACPKCFAELSRAVAAAPDIPVNTVKAEPKGLLDAHGGRQPRHAAIVRPGRNLSAQRRIAAAARLASSSNRSGEKMKVTRNDLRKRDKLLRN